jgi:hypothetical protein
MALTITHTSLTGAAANPDVLVDGPKWDANHTISGSIAASEVTGGAALTKTDDTNVTLTLGGTPTTALLQATSVTVGWTGTLAAARLNSNVVQSAVNDTNVTGSIAAQALTLGWTGNLATTRGGTGLTTYTQGDILYSSAADTLAKLAKDTNATRYLSNTGSSNNPAWAQVNLANGVTGTLTVPNGGSGVASATAYAVLCGGTTSTGAFQSIASVGTSGYVLTSNGAGALPTFQVAAGSLTAPQGRATLTSATPITTADVTAATSIYYAPDTGRYCPVYNGTSTTMRDFTSSSTDQVGQTLALDNDSGHTGYHQSGKNFYLFLADVSGVLYFGTGPAWTGDTTVGTGAGTTELEWFEGRWVNKVSMTLRHGSASGNTVTVPVRQGTCVAGFRATANGQATDAYDKRLLSNIYGISARQLLRRDTTDSWSWSTASYHQVNASASNQIETFCCFATSPIFLHHKAIPLNSTSTLRIVYAGIGINSATVQSASIAAFARIGDTSVVSQSPEADYTGFAPLGYTIWYMQEKGAGTDTQTWFGDGGGTDFQSGMAGWVWM